MICGRIKCYFESKGYGYIEDYDGHEVYFHFTSVEGAGSAELVSGTTVYFEALKTGMGLEAHRVQVTRELSA
jgi:cold shock protein